MGGAELVCQICQIPVEPNHYLLWNQCHGGCQCQALAHCEAQRHRAVDAETEIQFHFAKITWEKASIYYYD